MADLKLYNVAGESVSYSGITQVVIPNATSGSTTFTDTSDADAVAGDILSGKTAYVNGNKITGTNEGGGGGLKQFIEQHGTITSFEDPGCSIIGTYAFGYCSKLTTASFPVCTTMGNSAFGSCSKLTTASFPVCTTIGNYAFNWCINLTTVSFPMCTTIGTYAFAYCSSLTTVSFPMCTIIGSSAFNWCSQLTTVSFPVCTTISEGAFSVCHKLTAANFPMCTAIGSTAFAYCRSLTTVSFPMCTTIGSSAFGYCSKLTTVSFPVCTTISTYAFNDCYALTTCIFGNTATASSIYSSAFYRCYNLLSLYLLGSTLYNLQNINTFSSTPISTYTTSTGGVNGSIFVPQSLLASYQAATNWVTYSARFVGLTDAEVSRVMEIGTHIDPNSISFVISGTTYQAEDGMTWGEWVSSNYNTAGFYTDGYNIYLNTYTVASSSNTVDSAETIINGNTYHFVTSG